MCCSVPDVPWDLPFSGPDDTVLSLLLGVGESQCVGDSEVMVMLECDDGDGDAVV